MPVDKYRYKTVLFNVVESFIFYLFALEKAELSYKDWIE